MKITFYSNFLNHHQYPLCLEFINNPHVDFHFVATTKIEDERIKLGYKDMNSEPFVVRTYESLSFLKFADELCVESDVVIIGSAPEKYAKLRMKYNKLLFRYSERIFRNGIIHAFSPRAIINMWNLHTKYRNKNAYLLCASAFSASDFNRMGAYRNKSYRWGYFTEVKKYEDPDIIIKNKHKNSLLWVSRFISLKHPEIPLYIAKRLKEDDVDFTLSMIGNGELYSSVLEEIKKNNLQDNVFLLGSMSPEKVRQYMEESEIFLFTSDFQEGWGAVLNESMNSCCAVVASHAIGSVPFLISENFNGMIYNNNDLDGLYLKVKKLLKNDLLRKELQRNAYESMINEWNPHIAAERLISLSKMLLSNDEVIEMFDSGPCSKAIRISNNWYKDKL